MLSIENSLSKYSPLVRKIALQLMVRLPPSVELDDLIQAGMIGLLDAVRRYQEMMDAQFETYATARIRGAMLDELRNQDWMPRSVRIKAKRIEQAIQSLEKKLFRPPTHAEVAQHLDLSITAYHALLDDAQGIQILHYEDFTVENGENLEPEDHSSGPIWDRPVSGNPLNALLKEDLRQTLIESIDALPEREKLLLSLYYEQSLNLKEIGAVLNVTEARVCQLRTQAIMRIRAHLSQVSWLPKRTPK